MAPLKSCGQVLTAISASRPPVEPPAKYVRCGFVP